MPLGCRTCARLHWDYGKEPNRLAARNNSSFFLETDFYRGAAVIHRRPYSIDVIAQVCKQECARRYFADRQLIGGAVCKPGVCQRASAQTAVLVGKRVPFDCASTLLCRLPDAVPFSPEAHAR